MPLPEWIVIGDLHALAERLVTELGDVARQGVGARGEWTLAIPGGSVAERLLPLLWRAPLPWGACHVVWCDERMVPADDAASNQGAVRRAMPASMPWAMHPMPVDATDPELAAREYARTLRALMGPGGVLDAVLLGVGEDGHVASLFPGQGTLDETERTVVVEHEAPKAPPLRLSLTMPVLTRARLTCVAAFGEGKQAAVRDACDASGTTPVSRCLHQARRPLLLVDSDAAAFLPPR